ncbi:MAG: hypothetical protein M0T74_11000 [Desulfitobacterium hafniense]|nr:hypothetical protein [Desulfitobacterium hafniense]
MNVVTMNSYQTLRAWNRKIEEFPDIKGYEKMYYSFLCLEEQVSYMSQKYDSLYDEDVALAYAICGLRVIEILDSEQKYEFSNIALEVWEMVDRCMATFHPEDYGRIVGAENENVWHNLEDGLWETPEDREKHYRNVGSVLRRLTDSRKFWSKRQGLKGYIKYLSSFLKQNVSLDPLGTIHYSFMVRSEG